MEAFRHLSALIERPIQNVSNHDIASLSHRHLVEFCLAKGIGIGVDDANGIGNYSEEELRSKIAAFRDGISATNADTTTKTDEFDDDDDEDFASFDIEAAIQSASSPATTAFKVETRHPNLHAVETPPKRPHASQRGDQSSAEKRCKTASSPLATETTSSHTDIDIETMEQAIPADFASQMKSSLLTHFGHTTFRPGQLLLLHSILHNRDACAFWATGAGKSLTYQLPPLHLHQVGVIITPLVSLMQDQCAKLNTLVRSSGGGGEVATYLGSAQTDAFMEERALRGEFRLVYVTPEKLVAGNFLERLARMHRQGGRGKVCLFAVDESHCVSEWGHDFRPEFLKIGSSLRTHPILSSIPILALTATAVPRVQRDILTNLHMHPSEATIVKKSFDRPNLKIVIRRKPKNGPMAALDAVVKELAKGEGKIAKSTIVYCATRREVEEIAALLANSLSHLLEKERGISWDKATALANLLVKPYHAALSISDRTDSHLSFLVGKTAIIVATVAFGMGIDKPDIRRVIHWGPPKTVEEYYQQMGRASRDGLLGECILYCDMNDFNKYKGGFYLDKLRGEAKEATIKSMDALRDFCMKEDVCRRSALMGFFEEVPSFGKWCGTCDVCLFREANRDDLERDFSLDGARVLLLAVTLLKNQSWTSIEKVISGGKVESYKYSPTSVYSTRDLEFEKKRMKKKRSMAFLKELIPTMIDRGFLKQDLVHSNKAFKPYAVYGPGLKAAAVLKQNDCPIMLPVPPFIRELEVKEAEKRKQALAELEAAGVDLQQIPEEELEAGDGEVIAAFKHWHSYVDRLEKSGRAEFVNQMDDLKARIIAWRLDMAERFRIAPASVMEEHLVYKVAYATATLQSGRMEEDSLVAAGVRRNGIEELTKVLGEWSEMVNESKKNCSVASEQGQEKDLHMLFKPGEVHTPTKPWRFANYKPNKKTGKAAWEVSYLRFEKGEHPQTIAMKQDSGKVIQVSTVIGHILEALPQGRPVDLHRLASYTEPPTKQEWENLGRCELETGMNVTADPATSGANGEKFIIKEFLEPILGTAFTTKDYKDRTPEESESFSKWCGKLNWYMTLRRVGFEPSFEPASA